MGRVKKRVWQRMPELHKAAKAGDTTWIKKALRRGNNPNARNRWRETPLHTAVWSGLSRSVAALVESGVDLEWSDCRNGSPLWLATRLESASSVRILAQHGADVNRQLKSGKGPLYQHKGLGIVPRAGQAPMHMAASRGAWAREVITVLHEHGADVNLRDDAGRTPLHVSALSGKDRKRIFDLLVKLGADATLEDDKGKTPLDYLNAYSERASKRASKQADSKQTAAKKAPVPARNEAAPEQSAPRKSGGNARPRIVSPEERARVELAAVETVTAFYEARGFTVKSVEAENKGWDLEIRKGRKILHRVEVKGNKGGNILVELTPNEYEKSGDARFRLAVVRNALQSAPVCAIYGRDGEGWLRADGEDGGNDESAPGRLSTTEKISALVRAE